MRIEEDMKLDFKDVPFVQDSTLGSRKEVDPSQEDILLETINLNFLRMLDICIGVVHHGK